MRNELLCMTSSEQTVAGAKTGGLLVSNIHPSGAAIRNLSLLVNSFALDSASCILLNVVNDVLTVPPQIDWLLGLLTTVIVAKDELFKRHPASSRKNGKNVFGAIPTGLEEVRNMNIGLN